MCASARGELHSQDRRAVRTLLEAPYYPWIGLVSDRENGRCCAGSDCESDHHCRARKVPSNSHASLLGSVCGLASKGMLGRRTRRLRRCRTTTVFSTIFRDQLPFHSQDIDHTTLSNFLNPGVRTITNPSTHLLLSHLLA